MQSAILQSFVCLSSPTHPLPPWAGSGLVQVRSRLVEPGPHVAEHCVHSLHSVKLPFTKNNESNESIYKRNCITTIRITQFYNITL